MIRMIMMPSNHVTFTVPDKRESGSVRLCSPRRDGTIRKPTRDSCTVLCHGVCWGLSDWTILKLVAIG